MNVIYINLGQVLVSITWSLQSSWRGKERGHNNCHPYSFIFIKRITEYY